MQLVWRNEVEFQPSRAESEETGLAASGILLADESADVVVSEENLSKNGVANGGR